MVFSLTKRKREILDLLDEQEIVETAQGAVYYAGDPVFEEGILASFAADTMKGFRLMVEAVASDQDQVGERGPFRVDSDLVFARDLRGSFGFEFREILKDPQQTLLATPFRQAFRDIVSLLDAAADDDESFNELAASLSQRSLMTVQKFVKHVVSAHASVSIATPENKVELGHRRVESALGRLDTTSVEVEDTRIDGKLVGGVGENRQLEIETEDERFCIFFVAREFTPERVRAFISSNLGAIISLRGVERRVLRDGEFVRSRVTALSLDVGE